MHRLIKKTLETIEKKGYEAYLVGGYVRDFLLKNETYDIDICTNATPKELIKIFPNASTKNLGGIQFKLKEYNFEITTYREEIKYHQRRPIEYNYINNLLMDLNRRDFTINAICMNVKGEIIDLLNGKKDLENKEIVIIGSVLKKLQEDPLRILRAIRFATVLNFKIEDELYKSIQKNKNTILTLSNTRIKEELDKILFSPYAERGLSLLKDLGILEILKINYEEIIPIKSLIGMYAQIEVNYDLPFTKVEKESIKKIKEIKKIGTINNEVVYKYGLYLSKIGAAILNIDDATVNKIYQNLPIKDRKDICLDKSIMNVIKEKNQNIPLIINDLEKLIINGKIKNKKKDIIKYLKETRSL